MTKELVEIYAKPAAFSDSFTVGYQIYDNNEYAVLETISELGTFDSYQIRSKQEIKSYRSQTPYLKLYEEIIHFNKSNRTYDVYNLSELRPVVDNFKEACSYIQEHQLIATFVAINEENLLHAKVIDVKDESVDVELFDLERSCFDAQVNIEYEALVGIDIISAYTHMLNQVSHS
ncbi:hypothetical protein ACF3N8_09470 [Staphylococcus massiliensis]|uniref:hypothetical protein n=1 Tax=Staphylococcus massiliensis TaxID=555791 RepID=UPI001EDFC157|nr:hypothetical protein [Staphylococcus massiliensis]MCG3411890.1 hypothetical protein [Staphylococcus massiliensis]